MLILSNIARLFDGTSATKAALHEGVDLFLEDGRVYDRKPHDSGLVDGGSHTLVDCTGLTVVPGIVDAHGHVTALGLDDAGRNRMNGTAWLTYVEKVLHATLVDGGVTTLRDLGGATHLVKRMVDDGELIGPRLSIAICMLSTTGGHADFRGTDRCFESVSNLWPEIPGRPSSIVDGPWACRKRVREIAACGADWIKICTSPGVASPGDKLEHRDFTAEEVRAICDEAEARGLPVAAHAHTASGIRLAIENGVRDVQHISFLDDELADLAYAKGCTVTPTSWVVNDLPAADGLSEAVMAKVKQVGDVHARAVRTAREAGLDILAGTDAVLPGMHGRNFMEIVHLVRDGLPPLEAWYAATGRGAEAVGFADTGELRPGRRADLLACRGDVIEHPGLLDRGALVEVVKDGMGYRRGLEGVPQRTFADGVRQLLDPPPA